MIKHTKITKSMLYGLLTVAILGVLMLAAPTTHATTIDPTRVGSLSITKSAGDPLTQYGDPHNPLAPLSREPIAGITFTIQQIDVDLTTNEGWQKLQQLSKTELAPKGANANKLLAGTQQQATTGNDGIARFHGLKIGAYYVTEMPTTASEKHLSVIDPFVVTIPVTVGNDTWDYDVQAFAKDQKIMAEKSVNTPHACTSETVTFTINSTLPAPNANGDITRFEIVDPLDPNLHYQANTAHVYFTNTNARKEHQTLNATDYELKTDNHTLALSLTTQGLKKAAELRAGRTDLMLNLEFGATVSTLVPGEHINNKGYILPAGYPQFDHHTRPGVPTNNVAISCTGNTAVISRIPRLALTGAHVMWIIACGALLVALGFVLIRKNNQHTSGKEK